MKAAPYADWRSCVGWVGLFAASPHSLSAYILWGRACFGRRSDDSERSGAADDRSLRRAQLMPIALEQHQGGDQP